MECKQCGATLRPYARFCNVCGARQELTESEAAVSSPAAAQPTANVSTAAAPDITQEAGADAEAEANGNRARRPPRVPRATEEEQSAPPSEGAASVASATMGKLTSSADSEPAPAAASDAITEQDTDAAETAEKTEDMAASAASESTEVSASETPAATPIEALPATQADIPPTESAAPIAPPTDASAAVPVPVLTPTAAQPPAQWEDAETAEQSTIPGWVGSGEPMGMSNVRVTMPPITKLARTATSASVTDQPAISETEEPPSQRADGLPWPLPVSIIVGGRYRVEALIHAGPDEPDGENVYRITDLQGYEKCWSCHTEYGVTGASDRFCRECGADMLAREFLMYERHAAPEEADDEPVDMNAETLPEIDIEAGRGGSAAVVVDGEVRSFVQGTRAYRVMPRVVEPSPFPHGARIIAGAATDVGLTRPGERNEDSLGFLVLNLAYDSHMQPLALAIVADGLGGHVNGQDASRLVVRTVTNHILRSVALSLVDLPADGAATEEGLQAVLREAVRTANLALCTANDESGADMGSTAVAALLFGSTAYIANVGDSRAYVLEEQGQRRITTDHSLVEQLISGGFVKPEDRYTHPQRNQIYRSLGDEPDMQIDIFTQKLRPGVRLLLCCDGLWEMVRDDEIERILRETPHPQQACDLLVHQANEHGGEDNITAVIVEVSA